MRITKIRGTRVSCLVSIITNMFTTSKVDPITDARKEEFSDPPSVFNQLSRLIKETINIVKVCSK